MSAISAQRPPDRLGYQARSTEIYDDYHKSILAALGENGPILDIGAGSGHFRQMSDQIVSLDILRHRGWMWRRRRSITVCRWEYPALRCSTFCIICRSPMTFFNEAKRVLKPGGRIAMIEPGITPLSWLFFNFLHQEDVDMSVDPMADQPPIVAEDPFASNQGLPTLLFSRDRHRERFARIPEFTVRERRWLSLWAYPLSGGFKAMVFDPRVFGAFDFAVEKIMLPSSGL